MENFEVIHLPEKRQFVIEVNGYTGKVEYIMDDKNFNIIHTYVPHEIEGKGVASALVEAAYSYAKAHHLKCESTCSYAAIWLLRHPGF